jgi:hypothetical protein
METDHLSAKLAGLRRTAAGLLPQVYHHSHSLPAGDQYAPVLAVAKAHPDLTAKLVKKFGSEEHPRNINLEKVLKMQGCKTGEYRAVPLRLPLLFLHP